jgi:hypothetical protein
VDVSCGCEEVIELAHAATSRAIAKNGNIVIWHRMGVDSLPELGLLSWIMT